ncbi:hypothetical protein KDY119_02449 [Luteimicrobium xylanilyticum]|uniref:Uncharacterized protein n=1 Tax=Luteimicrobium xylanilyticum TaxID=1133546 RepID=A0A5P9QBX2_9MICO|nr:hypothetical protein KDY119_02449 [Luteimicrobium xylanilyticum]
MFPAASYPNDDDVVVPDGPVVLIPVTACGRADPAPGYVYAATVSPPEACVVCDVRFPTWS